MQKPKSRLSLAQLQALDAVARTGSITQAAKQLGIAQPSVSNHIQALESRYRTRFFTRSGYTTHVTPDLERLLPRIRALLALADDIEADLTQSSSLEAGALRIGYSTDPLAIPAISRFMSAYPNIKVEARAAASHDLLDMLNDGDIDLACVTGREPPNGFHAKVLAKTRVVIVVPKGHDLGKKPAVTWAELAGLPLIQRENSSATRRIFEAAARLNRITPNTLLALGSWASIASLILAGNGLGIAMEAEIAADERFQSIPIEDPNLRLSHFAVCSPDMVKVAAVDAFLESLPTPDHL